MENYESAKINKWSLLLAANISAMPTIGSGY
jgi:hypothetical protein